jgi:deoxyribodipyrimidine photolyase-related protein
MRHQATLAANPRMALQVRNLQRLDDAQRVALQRQADSIRNATG